MINSRYKILLLYDDIHPDIASFVSVIDENKNYILEVIKTDSFDNNFLDYNLIISCNVQNKIKTNVSNDYIFQNMSSLFNDICRRNKIKYY